MSAVLEAPTTTDLLEGVESLEPCHCEACAKDVVPLVAGLQRVPLPPADVLVDAFMRVREFVLDPDTPKVRRHMAVRFFSHPLVGEAFQEMRPCDEGTTHWCAIGRLGYELGIDEAGALCDTIAAHYYAPTVPWIWQRFDSNDTPGCVHAIDSVVAAIRAGQ